MLRNADSTAAQFRISSDRSRSARWNCLLLFILFNFGLASAQLTSLEIDALNNIRDAIVPANIWDTSNPDQCQWPGVICTMVGANQFVNELNLVTLGRFQISLPSSFQNFDRITKFSLANVNLTAPLPNFGSLLQLDFENVTNIQWPAGSQLFGFSTRYCTMNTLPRISDYPNLQYYGVTGGSVASYDPAILSCPNGHTLFWLVIQQIPLNGPLPNLTGCTSIGTLRLSELGLTGNNISMVFSPVAFDVGLSRNLLTGTIPKDIFSINSLNYLDLYGNKFSGPLDPDLLKMRSLRTLNLGSNMFSGSIHDVFDPTSSLSTLYLALNNLTGTIPPSLAAHPNIGFLFLQNNQLTGTIPKFLSQRLLTLQLSNNQFNGTIPDFVGSTSYYIIDLSNNQLTGTIPPSLYQVKNITVSLNLANNSLSGCVETARYVPVACDLSGNSFCCQSSTPLCPVITNCQCVQPKPAENATCIVDTNGNPVWLVVGNLIVATNNTNTTIQNGIIDGNLITLTPVTIDGVVVTGNLTVVGDLTVNNGIISVKGCAFVNGSLTLNLTPEEIEQLTLNGTITRDLIQYDSLCSDSTITFNSIVVNGELDCTELVGKQQNLPGLVTIVVTAAKVDCPGLAPFAPTPTLPDWAIGVIVAGGCLIVGAVVLAVLLSRRQKLKKKEQAISQRMATQSVTLSMAQKDA